MHEILIQNYGKCIIYIETISGRKSIKVFSVKPMSNLIYRIFLTCSQYVENNVRRRI